jgi:hypothetical protein
VLNAARLEEADDGPALRFTLVNPVDEPLFGVEVTVVVQGRSGERRWSRTAELAPGDVPVDPNQTRILEMHYIGPIEQTDYVTVSATSVRGISSTWSYARFVADADAAFAIPDLIVVNATDAPVNIVGEKLIHNSLGGPAVASFLVRNETADSTRDVRLKFFVFDEQNRLRSEAERGWEAPILGRTSVEVTQELQQPDAKQGWKVVVGVYQGTRGGQLWANPTLKETAKSSIIPKPRWKPEMMQAPEKVAQR